VDALLEREELLGELERARVAGGRLVFVGGEAGVGKTSLVRVLAERSGAPVLVGACENLTTPTTLGPFLDLGIDADEPRRVAAQLLGQLEREPCVFMLEDVHWADQATLDVLRVLGRRIDRTASLVLATYRDDEVGEDHPLRVVLGELASARGVSRLTVPRLSLEAVRTLAAEHGADGDAIHRVTGGNAFYVTEVLAAADADVPETVRDAVLARASVLGREARGILDVAALVPGRVELWVLERAAGPLAPLDDCVSSGMLGLVDDGVAFRHELARLAVESAVPGVRRKTLHAAILDALRSPPAGEPDPARLAHHAEEAGDVAAVLEHARAAAVRAEHAWSHREAFAQYTRVLRHAELLSRREHADALAALALHASATGRAREAIDARLAAIEAYRELGDDVAVGDNTARLATMGYVGVGDNDAAERASLAAIEILERADAPRELAYAYLTQAYLRMLSRDNADGVLWGERSLELAEALGDAELRSFALNMIGTSRVMAGDIEPGIADLEHAIAVAAESGIIDRVGSGYSMLASGLGEMYELERAERFAREFFAHADQTGVDDSYIRSWLACVHVYRGRWDEATSTARIVLTYATAIGRITSLIALGRVRARRGDPGAFDALDEALELATPGGHLQRLGHVRAARAEAAYLAGDREGARAEARAVYALALEKRHLWFAGELAYWQAKVEALDEVPDWIAEPYRLQLAGRAPAAAESWRRRGCVYEAARALAESDDEADVRAGLQELERLGALPAARLARERLRALGAAVPRGPRASTRANPASLTARELDVLRLVAAGKRNAEVAEELVLSRRTVDHHVSAILRKLEVRTRGEAAAEATRLGLLQDR
jgi:DNA-binding CsgD family transcriptional regulator